MVQPRIFLFESRPAPCSLTLQFKLTAVRTVARPEIAALSWSVGLVIDGT